MKAIRDFLNIIREAFNFAVFSLLAQKLRTGLSLVGVVLGIFSIVFVLSLIDSLKSNIENDMAQIGKDVVFVKKINFIELRSEADYMRQRSRPALTIGESKKLVELSNEIEAASFLAVTENESIKGNKTQLNNTLIMGITQAFTETSVVNIEAGRYFTELEQLHALPVTIISKEISDALFPIRGAINQNIYIKGVPHKVIGLLKEAGESMFNPNGGSMVYIPAKAFGKIYKLNAEQHDATFIVKPKPNIALEALQEEIAIKMRAIRRLKPYQENNFSSFSSAMIEEMMGEIFGIMNSVGAIIGIFALLVGAFGISNILSVSVKERTAEIGIQKALGARNIYILTQFLFEAVFLCVVGGLISLLIIYTIFELVNNQMDLSLRLILSERNILLGVVLSVVVGVLSGIFPAFKAARMHPVKAISAG
jgi:putative ABC transport system permease protein